MADIYVIRDNKMKCDVFMFMQQNAGAAGSYFYNWALMQNSKDVSLYSIGSAEFIDASSEYEITIVDRSYICDFPTLIDAPTQDTSNHG